MSDLLAGKTILITGGTSRLGEAFITRALKEGAAICFTYHRSEEKATRLQEAGAKAFRLDLADRRAVRDFARELKAELSCLDGLIHNAAATADATVINMEEEAWDRVLEVGLSAPYCLTKTLSPLLFKARQAKVLMLTSRTAFQGSAGVCNYTAAKAGLIGLTKSLAQELGKKRLLVNALNPGFMKSAMTERLNADAVEYHMQLNPLREYSDPDEVAGFMCYLMSGFVTQVTGQVFHFEGRKLPYG